MRQKIKVLLISVIFHLLIYLFSTQNSTIRVVATTVPLMFIDLKDLLCLWGALHFRIIYILKSLFTTVDYLLHLIFGDKSAVISKSVVSKVFAAVIPHMLLFVINSNLFVPELQYLILSFLLRESGASH